MVLRLMTLLVRLECPPGGLQDCRMARVPDAREPVGIRRRIARPPQGSAGHQQLQI